MAMMTPLSGLGRDPIGDLGFNQRPSWGFGGGPEARPSVGSAEDWFGAQGAPDGGVPSGWGPGNPDYDRGMNEGWGRAIFGGGGGAPAGGMAGSAGPTTPDMLQQLQTSPGYQFRLGEGLKALERSAAGRGTLLTGGTLKGAQRYAQDYASGEYQNRFNQLAGLLGMGYGAAGAQANLGADYARLGGDVLTGAGNARAAGTVGGANAWQNALGGVGNMAQMYYLNRLFGGAPAMGGTPALAGGWTPVMPGTY